MMRALSRTEIPVNSSPKSGKEEKEEKGEFGGGGGGDVIVKSSLILQFLQSGVFSIISKSIITSTS